jgi:hypothetical protein
MGPFLFDRKDEPMKKTYHIKIFTKELQTKFNIESNTDIDTVEELHKPIIDFLGKNDIDWEPNPLKFSGTATGAGFYITYEEVNNGSRQHGVVREEAQARI